MAKGTYKRFQLPAVVLFFCFCIVSVALGQAEEWPQIDADGLFTFRLPKGFTKTDLSGVEHYMGEYYQGKTRFIFISGDTASNAYDVRRQPKMGDYQESEITIDGRRANIRTFSEVEDGQRSYRAELNIGDWQKANVELYMELESSEARDLELAKQIFQSIKFAAKGL